METKMIVMNVKLYRPDEHDAFYEDSAEFAGDESEVIDLISGVLNSIDSEQN